MPLSRSLSVLRSRLVTDPAWTVYALGDLAPQHFERAEWHIEARGEPAVLLLYRAFDTPVLLTHGSAAALAPLLDEVANERALYLSVRPAILPLIRERWSVRVETPMWRMTLDPADFRPAPVANGAPVHLGLDHLPQIEALFATGHALGDAPDFFAADMVEQGAFYGLFKGDDLVSVAGTHLLAPAEGVAAVGCVYTRLDCRGRGMAAQATGAVTAHLLAGQPAPGLIALNVTQGNTTARRVYQRLGYRPYCAFYEGHALHG